MLVRANAGYSLTNPPSGPAPVYIGFGSLILDNPEKLTQDFLKVGRCTPTHAYNQVLSEQRVVLMLTNVSILLLL